MPPSAPSQAPSRIAAARAAQPAWAARSVRDRTRALQELRVEITLRTDDILAAITADLGKPPMDILTGDIMVTLEHLRFCERHAHHILRAKRIGKPAFFFLGTHFEQVYEPHGVALVLAPWNYPLQLALVPAITALVAGNAVILKCSEHTPRTAALITSLIAAAGLPKDLLQVSSESAQEAAALLDAKPDFVFFTGSSKNGAAIATQAAAHHIPSAMELGGKDAALVFDSADLTRTVEGLVYSVFSNAGQVCVGTKRIYVHQSLYGRFVTAFVQRTNSLRLGTDIGPIAFPQVATLLEDQVQNALARGAQLHPTSIEQLRILTDVPADARLIIEESFGPVVCIAPFQSEADAIRLANDSSFALSAGIWTGDKTQGQRVAAALTSGSVCINDAIRYIGNPYAPFGGNRASGSARYHGAAGLHALSRTKTIMTATFLRKREIHWFPFTETTFNLVRKLLQLRHTGIKGLFTK